MYELPTSIIVKDKEFHITNQGDFRMVLDCFDALNDEEMGEDYQILASLIIFFEEFDDILDVQDNSEYTTELTREMFKFFNCGNTEVIGAVTSKPVIDWASDSQMICSAVNKVANTEIRALEYLHWWTFMGYYMSVGESVLSTVVSIRDKINRGKSLEKWEKEFRRDNPQYFMWKKKSLDEQRLEAVISGLWNTGGEE